MLEPISTIIPEITIHDGRAVTTSLAVSAYFQKRHDHVMEKIRAVMADCDPGWRLPNFRETFYARENPNGGEGIATPMFELTRDAFVLIVMGFTGKKALQWKIDYIEAFNKMEAELNAPHLPDIHHADSRTVLIRFDEKGDVIFSEKVPEGSVVSTIDRFKFWAEQNGWLVINKQELRHMTLDQLTALR